MSIEAVRWALRFDDLPRDQRTGEASSSCAFVLVVLAEHASKDGTDSFPSVETIRQCTKFTERTVRYALRALEEHGTIRPTPEPAKRDGQIYDPRRRPQSYDIAPFMEQAAREGAVGSPTSGGQTLDPGGQSLGGKVSSGGQTPALLGGKLDGDFAPDPLKDPKEQTEDPSSSEAADAASDQKIRPDVDELCALLHDLMIENGCTVPPIGKRWRDAARLLLDRDKRPLDEAREVLAWSQDDEFWRTNIQSMPTFRAKYDKLRLRWQQAAPVRYLRSEDAIRNWLRDLWRDGRVKPIEERSGLRYPQPELPEGISSVEKAREFHLTAIRTWINDNREEIIRCIQQREQPAAS